MTNTRKKNNSRSHKKLKTSIRRRRGGGLLSFWGMNKCSNYSKELEKRLVNQFNDKDWVVQKRTEYYKNEYKLSSKDITNFN